MNNARITDVAIAIARLPLTINVGHVELVAFLSSLPEFQEPKSPWVQCSERMPLRDRLVLVMTDGTTLGDGFILTTFQGSHPNPRLVKWMEIPEDDQPESELVRKFKERLKFRGMTVDKHNAILDSLLEAEKEIADAQA